MMWLSSKLQIDCNLVNLHCECFQQGTSKLGMHIEVAQDQPRRPTLERQVSMATSDFRSIKPSVLLVSQATAQQTILLQDLIHSVHRVIVFQCLYAFPGWFAGRGRIRVGCRRRTSCSRATPADLPAEGQITYAAWSALLPWAPRIKMPALPSSSLCRQHCFVSCRFCPPSTNLTANLL